VTLKTSVSSARHTRPRSMISRPWCSKVSIEFVPDIGTLIEYALYSG